MNAPHSDPAPADPLPDDRAAQALIDALRATFARNANRANAVPMQAYMKSALPFHGIHTPHRRRLTQEVAARHPIADTAALAAAMRSLWRQAEFREERYAALELGRTGDNARLLGLGLLPVYEEMIRTGAWWDYCDDISGTALARLLEAHPREMKPVLRRWAAGTDPWLRRAAMLCQRRTKAVDAKLLYDCILPSVDSDEFFLRKAIAWALRERSYGAPQEVIAFVQRYGERLSPLTKREALKVVARRART